MYITKKKKKKSVYASSLLFLPTDVAAEEDSPALMKRSSNKSRGTTALSLRSLLLCHVLIALIQTKHQQFFTSTRQRDTVSNFVLLMFYATRSSVSLSLSLSPYCFAPSEAARVRDGGNTSLPGMEGKIDLMHLSSLCQHFWKSADFTHRRRCVSFMLPLSVPVEPGCEV